jgi:hypothetical protein
MIMLGTAGEGMAGEAGGAEQAAMNRSELNESRRDLRIGDGETEAA